MKKIDWLIHHVIGQYCPAGLANVHTHGMQEYAHMDFQIVLNVTPADICYLLNSMGLRVQRGERFKAGDMVKGLYTDCDIRLDLAHETGRKVLRLIIPDKNNFFPEDPKCSIPYKYQAKVVFI